MTGQWPNYPSNSEEYRYYAKRTELSVEQGCLMLGMRVIIPKVLQKNVLETLHESHVGVTRMKMLSRSYVYWPSLDHDIVNLCQSCNQCVNKMKHPPKSTLHPWEFPKRPWHRVHLDFVGPFQGHMFLLLQDAHSKWPEIAVMKSTTAEKTLDVIHTWVARFELVNEIVTDNGPQFTSDIFKSFCNQYNIKHIFCAPFHPSSNGQAERLVQSPKTHSNVKRTIQFRYKRKYVNFCSVTGTHLTSQLTQHQLSLCLADV